MKHLFPSLLIGALAVLLAPAASAQRLVASAPSTAYGHGGYASSRVWVPARYETVYERVWVPGRTERVWVEPVYRFRYGSCGTRFRVLVCAGHWRTLHHPGHYETRAVRVQHPGHWIARASCD